MPDEEQQSGSDDAVSVKGPGGWGASAKGRDTVLVFFVGILIFLGYLHHKDQDSKSVESLSQHQKIEDKFNEMIYVLSLSQPDREKLNLTMPSSLREKAHRKRHAEEER